MMSNGLVSPQTTIKAARPSSSTQPLIDKAVAFDAVVDSPLPIKRNRLGLRLLNNCLHELVFLNASTPLQAPVDTATEAAVAQLNAYFDDPRTGFSIDLAPQGTVFQRRVWQALIACPIGNTRTYGEVAKAIKSGPRAVGNACRRNPIPIFIPCHRVVAQHGLGGYAGQTSGMNMVLKQWLLSHESAI